MQNGVVFYCAHSEDPEDLVSFHRKGFGFFGILDLEDGVVVSEEDFFSFGGHLDMRVVGVSGEVLDGREISGIPDGDVPAELSDNEVALKIEEVIRSLRDIKGGLPGESIGHCQGQQQKC